jgi:hypothetical protein
MYISHAFPDEFLAHEHRVPLNPPVARGKVTCCQASRSNALSMIRLTGNEEEN